MRSILISGIPTAVEGFVPESFSADDSLRLKKLISWEYDSAQKKYLVQRKLPHRVGRVVVKNIVYSVVPDMSALDFTTFFLYSLGVRLDRFAANHSSQIATAYGNDYPDFRTLAATLLVLTAEEIAGSFLAKGYVRKAERLNTIRGRIDWKERNRPGPRSDIPCIFSEISLDNLLNRIVCAGLRAVKDVPILPIFRRRLNEQVFTWSSIATSKHIRLSDLQLAEKSVNKLTEKYRGIIGLCRMVMFGYGPEDFFNAGNSNFQCLEFDLAMIYERFVLRIIEQRIAGSCLSVEAQVRERLGLRNGYGQTYHETRPDFLVKCDGFPVAVMDAKFKPRYVSQEGTFARRNKVSEADVYQLLFYAQRASQLAHGASIPAFIVSPRIDNYSVVPDKPLRQINWVHDGRTEVSIDVIDIDFGRTIEAIRSQTELPHDGLAIACESLLARHSSTGRAYEGPPTVASKPVEPHTPAAPNHSTGLARLTQPTH